MKKTDRSLMGGREKGEDLVKEDDGIFSST